jgi:hypothetical protein
MERKRTLRILKRGLNMSENQITTTSQQQEVVVHGAFANITSFENAQRMATALSRSDLVPSNYKDKVANCLVALEVAQRTGSSIMAVMQNMHVIHGRPSWSASYIIAAINSCGRFETLKFETTGEGDKRQCVAWTREKGTKDVIRGPAVSIAMAKAEGWHGKSGSKWQTMPELMLQYRAAAFFGRLYVPDVLMGMQSDDELRDVTPDQEPSPSQSTPTANAADAINKKVKSAKKTAPPVIDVTPVTLDAEPAPISSESIEAKPGAESESEFF